MAASAEKDRTRSIIATTEHWTGRLRHGIACGMNSAMMIRQGGWQSWAVWGLLTALLFVALIPRGYMPDVQALRRGALSLTICGLVEPGQGDAKTATHLDQVAACPFGLLPSLSAPTGSVAMPLPRQWGVMAAGIVTALVSGQRVWIAGLGARGPPGL
ncbi:hypothetical protein CHU95_01545 [Niveispirillum lacus]|uniref:DUF2946 domain-containing protein n=1 Tax=Niveispirillum lacus TaxID=1981099 RepID=A0A255Z918_9PROT|nr:hypothetical protein CHU95_01545 [Niveispirillum lacus]